MHSSRDECIFKYINKEYSPFSKMLLDVETIYNDSKKISELKKLTTITKHQENSWLPLAQYNSRTNTYANAAISIQAITAYSYERAVAHTEGILGAYWSNLKNVGDQEKYHEIEDAIGKSGIASNVVAYAFTYTLQHFDWQIVNGSYIPDYYIPLDPDDLMGTKKPMEAPVREELFPSDAGENNEEINSEEENGE